MSESLKSLFVEYGFLVDQSAQAKAEVALKASEARVTANQVAEATKRIEAERRAHVDRIAASAAAGKELTEHEKNLLVARDREQKAQAEREEKLHREHADKARKQEDDNAKKQRERREASFKQLSEFTLRAASLAAKVVAGIEGVAAGILYTTDKAAAGLEKLKYSAEISGASIKGMNSFVYAITQLGGSAESAQASFTKFTDNLKFKGFETTLNNMGVATRLANGEMRKSEDIITDYVESLKKYDRAQAESQGGAWGVEADTVNASRRPGLRKYEGEYNRDQAAVGNDPDANADGAVRFERSSRRLKSAVGAVVGRFTGTLFDQLQPQLNALSNWIDQHGTQVANIINRISSDIIKLARAVLGHLSQVNWTEILTKVENFAKEFDEKATKYFGEGGSILVTFAAFGAVLTSKVLGPLNLIAAALKVATTGTMGLLGAGGGLGGVVAGIVAAGGAAGAMNSGHAGEYGEDAGTWGGDAPLKDSDLPKGRPTVNFSTMWGWLKGKVGLGGSQDASDTADTSRAQKAIVDTAENTGKIVAHLEKSDSSFNANGGGGGAGGGSGTGAGAPNMRYGRTGGGDVGPYRGAGRPAKGALAANQKEAYAAALGEGLSPTAARALVANMSGEGLAVPGDVHWDSTHTARGIVQWDPTRSEAIKRQFGKYPNEMSVGEQTKAAIWEINHNPTYAETKNALHGGGSADSMIGTLVRNYERPRDKECAIRTRQAFYAGFKPGETAPSAPSATAIPAPSSAEDAMRAAAARVRAGGRDPKDKALVEQYLRGQHAKATKYDNQEHRQGGGSYPSSTEPDGTTTVDRRDMRFAPKPSDAPVKVEVTKAPALDAAHQKLADAMRHKLNETIMAHAHAGTLGGYLTRHHHPLGDSSALRASISHSVRGDTSVVHNPTYNIQATDPKVAMSAALSASDRSQQNLVRNMRR